MLSVKKSLIEFHVFVVALTLLSGCVTTTSRYLVPPSAEQPFKSKEDLDVYLTQSVRLKRVAQRVMTGLSDGSVLKTEKVRQPPFTCVSMTDWHRSMFGLYGSNGLVIAGLLSPEKVPLSDVRCGDELIGVNGRVVRTASALIDFLLANRDQESRCRFKRGEYEWDEYMPLVDYYKKPEFALDPKRESRKGWTDGKGIVILNRTMLEMATTDDELALVIAHELAHIELGHYKSRQTMQLGEAIVSGAVSGLVTAFLTGKSGTVVYGNYQMSNAIGRIAGQVAISPFSKKQESAADALGLSMLQQAGFDLRQAITIMLKMRKAGTGFSFTHPDPGDRYEKLQQAIKEIEQMKASGKILRSEPESSEV